MYSEHSNRYERLKDVIFEYISDENTSAETLFDDIIAEVKESYEYFLKYSTKCQKLMKLFNSHRSGEPIEITNARIQSMSPYNDGWTQEFYREMVDNYVKENVGVASDGDYEDFWENCDESKSLKMYEC